MKPEKSSSRDKPNRRHYSTIRFLGVQHEDMKPQENISCNCLFTDDRNLIDPLAVLARVNNEENKSVCLAAIDWQKPQIKRRRQRVLRFIDSFFCAVFPSD